MLRSSLPSESIGQNALLQALEGDISAWSGFLATHPHRDGLALVQSCKDERLRRMTHRSGRPDPTWFQHMMETHSSISLRGRTHEMSVADKILFETWNVLRHRLSLQIAERVRELPRSGFILYLSEYLEWCLVLRYAISGSALTLKLMHAIEQPEAVYDIYALIHLADDTTRGVMRNVMKSPAKLVAHRGVLIHVDRYSEGSVFGPSIDTVYLHEALAQLIFEANDVQTRVGPEVHSAIEVGCGSGFVSAGLLANLPMLQRLTVFDIDLNAIQCTIRNIHALPEKHRAVVHAIYGEFYPEVVGTKFDLLISNPPYLPVPVPNASAENFRSYQQAVGGTELLELLISTGMQVVEKNGIIVLIYSDLAQPEFDRSLSDDLVVVPLLEIGGHSVLFDVEDVFEAPDWHEFLAENRGLKRDVHTGLHRHKVKIVALLRKVEAEAPAPSTLAARVAQIARQHQTT